MIKLELTKEQNKFVLVTLKKGHQVKIGMLGILKKRKRAKWTGFHNLSGKVITTPAHNVVAFQVSATLKRKIKNG